MSNGPLAFLAQLADGRTCVGTDRDGEARLTILLSRHDAAALMQRLDEFQAGFYCTLVAEAAVQQPTPTPRKRGRA